MTTQPPQAVDIGFHQGMTLIRLAEKYRTVLLVILEAIQNSIDAEPENIAVYVDLKERTILVNDDGEGATDEEIRAGLSAICKSQKVKGKLGRFGIGFISPIDLCEEFWFTSISYRKNRYGPCYHRWTFNQDDITSQEQVRIPFEEMPDLRAPRQRRAGGSRRVPWHSELRIRNYSTDSRVSRGLNFENLKAQILGRFSESISVGGITIRLTLVDGSAKHEEVLRPNVFQGAPLERVFYTIEGGGGVVFDLSHVAIVGNRRPGFVNFYEARSRNEQDIYPHPIRTSSFLAHAHEAGSIDPDVYEALTSGIFEGRIWATCVEVAPDRERFVDNDGFRQLVHIVNQWFNDIGGMIWLEDQDRRAEDRWETAGKRILKRLMSDAQGGDLQRLLEDFDLPSGKKSSIASGVSSKSGKGNESGDDGRGSIRAPRASASGSPKGKLGKKLHISIEYVEELYSNDLVSFDWENGIVRFNVRNPYFIECDKPGKERWFEHMVQYALVQFIISYSEAPSERDMILMFLNRGIGLYSHVIIRGDTDRRRRR